MVKENKFGGERLESKSSLSRNNLLEHLARYRLLPGGDFKVLDLGCGAGHGSNLLAEKYSQVTGLDISIDAIDYAKKNWSRPNIDFVVGDSMSIPFESGSFAYRDWETHNLILFYKNPLIATTPLPYPQSHP